MPSVPIPAALKLPPGQGPFPAIVVLHGCGGRGGTAPTVTDADLVLGLLDSKRMLAGGVRLDEPAAFRAIASLGEGNGRKRAQGLALDDRGASDPKQHVPRLDAGRRDANGQARASQIGHPIRMDLRFHGIDRTRCQRLRRVRFA